MFLRFYLVEILTLLLNIEFLDKQNRGSLLIEITPWPGKTVEETIEDNFSRLHQAWKKI